jgi:hypothetical protein
MPPALTAKTFGMPRWAWLILLAGGIGFGLALRRNREEQADADAMLDEEAEIMLETGDPLDAGLYDDPGMAGVGVYGQSPASVVPVQAPVIPEGFVDQSAVLGDVLSTFIDSWGRPPDATQGSGNRPPKPPVTPAGKSWVWNGRQWILVTKPTAGRPGGGDGNGRPPRPSRNPRPGHEWFWNGSKWVQRGIGNNRPAGGSGGAGRGKPAAALTGGGPPRVPVTAHMPVQRAAPIRRPVVRRPPPRPPVRRRTIRR